MSLKNPTASVTINGTDYGPSTGQKKVTSFWCTDEDLAFGMGKFSITVADSDGTVASAFPAWTTEVGLWKTVTIVINGVTVFTGKTEKISFETGSGGDMVVFDGYSVAGELANMFITHDFSVDATSERQVGMTAAQFLKAAFTNAGRTFTDINSFNFEQDGGAYPSANTSPGFIRQRYALDILRDVLSATGYAARIDTSNVFHFFDPTNPAYRLPTGPIISVYPSASNNLKEGRTVRDIHETKNYLEFNGAGQGYDPYSNGLTATGANWAPNLNNDANDVPPTIPGTGYPSLIYPIPTPSLGATFTATFNFNMFSYGIKNDVDQTRGLLNLLFNNKTGMHLWTKVKTETVPLTTMVSATTYTVQFIDFPSGNTATLATGIPLANGAWDEKTHPVPFQNFVPNLAGQTNPYTYAGTFNFSGISSMSVTFFPGSYAFPFGQPLPTKLTDVGLNNIYFVCQPFYVPYANPNVDHTNTPLVADTTYGERDQTHNAGSEFTQQIDLQNYGDAVYGSYPNPMLRSVLTVLVDPNVILYKAGYSIPLNIPRWGYSTAYWRILQVRFEFSPKGMIQKLDLTPIINQ